MRFASVRIVTAEVDRLVAFYERLLGRSAERLAPVFAEFRSDTGTLAVGDVRTVPVEGLRTGGSGVLVEFLVDDVDATFAEVSSWAPEVVQEPTTMPWGNRSAIVRDPDGNLVNLFAPVTDAARTRFA